MYDEDDRVIEVEEGEGITVCTDEVVQDLAGIVVGIEQEHKENKEGTSMLSTDVGRVAKSYMEVWLSKIVDDGGELLEDKTTVGELLLFIATVQAEMDLGASGGHIN